MGTEKQAPVQQTASPLHSVQAQSPAAEYAVGHAPSLDRIQALPPSSLRPSDIQALQRLIGNRAVQRVLASQPDNHLTADLQRESDSEVSSGTSGSNTSLRDLSRATEARAGALIKAGKKQEALDVIVAEVGDRLMPLLTQVYQSRFLYASTLTRLNGVVKCLPTASEKDDPACKQVVVAIGDSAFKRGVPDLYSTMLHEYKHVEQWQSNRAEFVTETEELLDETRSLSAVREFEAYAHKILTSTRTGIDARTMTNAGKKMWEEGWSRMSQPDRELHRQEYEMCIQAVRLKTGNFSWDPSL